MEATEGPQAAQPNAAQAPCEHSTFAIMPVTLGKQVTTTKAVYMGDHQLEHAAMMVPMRLSSVSKASVCVAVLESASMSCDVTGTKVQSVQW